LFAQPVAVVAAIHDHVSTLQDFCYCDHLGWKWCPALFVTPRTQKVSFNAN
jgi:hypothetical protein